MLIFILCIYHSIWIYIEYLSNNSGLSILNYINEYNRNDIWMCVSKFMTLINSIQCSLDSIILYVYPIFFIIPQNNSSLLMIYFISNEIYQLPLNITWLLIRLNLSPEGLILKISYLITLIASVLLNILST